MAQTALQYVTRYWRKDNKTLWMLNSVARTMSITAGVVVEDGKIVDITVMTYRESRGHEVQSRHHPCAICRREHYE